MPQTARLNMNNYGKAAAPLTGLSSKNYSAATAGDQAKTGPGVFTGLTVNTLAAASSVTVYDGTSTAGKKLGTWPSTAVAQFASQLAFTTGLFVVIAGGNPDVTVSWQ